MQSLQAFTAGEQIRASCSRPSKFCTPNACMTDKVQRSEPVPRRQPPAQEPPPATWCACNVSSPRQHPSCAGAQHAFRSQNPQMAEVSCTGQASVCVAYAGGPWHGSNLRTDEPRARTALFAREPNAAQQQAVAQRRLNAALDDVHSI